jgi:hypothetical protein
MMSFTNNPAYLIRPLSCACLSHSKN